MRTALYIFFLLFMCTASGIAADLDATKPRRLAAAGWQSLFIDDSGIVWQWGGRQWRPRPVFSSARYVALGAYGTAIAVAYDYTLWGWGKTEEGQLGVFRKKVVKKPLKIMTDTLAAVNIWRSMLAVKKDYSLWVWGSSALLRNFIKKNSASPRKILNNVAQISITGFHALALRTDGSLWAWGSNICGGVGDNGSRGDRSRPVRVNVDNLEGRRITSVATRENESFAVTEDGLVWHWGTTDPTCAEYGDYPDIPERVPFLDDVREIRTEDSGSALALKKDGTVWAWGGDSQLGLDSENWEKPKFMLADVLEIAVGSYHALALKKDGTVWAWGNNESGQLADEHLKFSREPRQIIFPPLPVPATEAKKDANSQ